MQQSESILDLATALSLAQAEMGGAVKDSNNPFFKSNYADLTSVIKAIKEPFSKHGLSFVQLPVTSVGGNGIGVATMLMHYSGQWIKSEYLLPMDKVTPQGAGSAITYARRYALQALVGIPSVDDDSEMAMYRNEPAPVAIPHKRVSKALMQSCMVLIIEAETSGDHSLMNEALGELDEIEKQKLWGQLTGKQQEFVRSKKGM
jgi:hypothetical protein